MRNYNFIWVILFLSLSLVTCKKRTISTLPQGISTTITDVFFTAVQITGEIESDGGKEIKELGVCWSLNVNATIDDNKMILPQKVSEVTSRFFKTKIKKFAFAGVVDGLTIATDYYFRAYAINENGIVYGNEVHIKTKKKPDPIQFNSQIKYDSIVDNEGTYYKTVKIGNQVWMAENLKTMHYNNGDLINDTMVDLFSKSEYYLPVYGRLYQYYVITDTRGICPDGWRIPSKSDWEALLNFIVNDLSKVKETGSSHWTNNSSSNNVTGFTAIPCGYKLGSSNTIIGIGNFADFWTSTAADANTIYNFGIFDNFNFFNDAKTSLFSIRCIKN